MNAYINTKTNEYPLYEGDIRLLYPDMGEVFVLPERFAEVTEGVRPEVTETQTFEETQPRQKADGTYERVYVVRDWTNEELEANRAQVDFYMSGMRLTADPDAVEQPGLE